MRDFSPEFFMLEYDGITYCISVSHIVRVEFGRKEAALVLSDGKRFPLKGKAVEDIHEWINGGGWQSIGESSEVKIGGKTFSETMRELDEIAREPKTDSD